MIKGGGSTKNGDSSSNLAATTMPLSEKPKSSSDAFDCKFFNDFSFVNGALVVDDVVAVDVRTILFVINEYCWYNNMNIRS